MSIVEQVHGFLISILECGVLLCGQDAIHHGRVDQLDASSVKQASERVKGVIYPRTGLYSELDFITLK